MATEYDESDFDFISNVPVSKPVLRPWDEVVSFQGFAWSPDYGIIHELSKDEDIVPDLKNMSVNKQTVVNDTYRPQVTEADFE